MHLHPADVPGGYSAVLTFTAPYAVPNALSGYSIASPTPCHQGTTIDPIDRDVNAGATVTVPWKRYSPTPAGANVFLEVLYSNRQATPTAGVGSVLVGRAVVKQPR